MKMYRNGEKVAEHIRNRTLFKIGNMSGDWYSSDNPPHMGIMPASSKSEILELLKDRDVYVVHSYLTPIAYAWNKTVHVPEIRYSATTSDHQSIARRANH